MNVTLSAWHGDSDFKKKKNIMADQASAHLLCSEGGGGQDAPQIFSGGRGFSTPGWHL